jgi:hypothetical protein
VLPNAVAARIVIEGGPARGMEILRQDRRETVCVEREIIPCDGTVNLPRF